MATVDTLSVSFTPSAMAELKDIQVQEGAGADKGLRVGVKGGGCSGLSYILEFDAPGAFDDIFEIDGLKVLLDKRHALYISGMQVDFQAGLNDRGFIFENPQAKTSCGCGTSFSA